MIGISAHGTVFIHSAPAALLPHVEWAIAKMLGSPAGLCWAPQASVAKTFRAELAFSSEPSLVPALASDLLGWGAVRFEIVQDESRGIAGWRWAFTPGLGLFQGQIDSFGSALINEHRLSSILDCGNLPDAKHQIGLALGKPWDDELESYRTASEDPSVVWLKSVAN